MRKLLIALVLITVTVASCTKYDIAQPTSNSMYQIRIAAVEDQGISSYTPVSRVKAGKVAVEFETAEVSGVKEYNIEISNDGITFKKVKSIAADLQSPNKIYRDTVILE